MSRARIFAATLVLCGCAAGTAQAAPTARMTAAFTPERLGAPTTISASFTLAWSERRPPVLTRVQLAYPRNLGFATSGLGLAPCDATLLEEDGPEESPANSRVGGGTALVEVPIGGQLYREATALTIVAGPSPNGYLQLLVSAVGRSPVVAHLVLSAELLPDRLGIVVPPIPTLPEGPYVALVAMHLTLGGQLTYYERVHGKTVAYHPAGSGCSANVPAAASRSPRGSRSSTDGHADAHTRVRCPQHR